ncbi:MULTISPECIES: hypothetical protein [unclassified Streptomyces]|uniref:hypothetical protein n=1 Tax=unclassified Streptomyces TaxID=2593676 RepID=UPI0038309A93
MARDTGGEGSSTRYYAAVRLADGSTERVETDTGQERPAVGESVGVTVDPRHRVGNRFGAPPGEPDGKVAVTGFVALCAGAPAFSVALLRSVRRMPG